MKGVKKVFNCVAKRIKKYFFKCEDNEIYQACGKFKKMAEEVITIEDFVLTEEYAIKYNATTRWQTI